LPVPIDEPVPPLVEPVPVDEPLPNPPGVGVVLEPEPIEEPLPVEEPLPIEEPVLPDVPPAELELPWSRRH
jgi:hypothetical protein